MVYQSSTCLISGSESTTIEPTTGGPSGSTVTHSSTTTPDNNTPNVLPIAGGVAAAVILILVIVLIVYCVHIKRKKMEERADESGLEAYGRNETPSRNMAADESKETNNDSHNQKTKEIAKVPKTQENLHGTEV